MRILIIGGGRTGRHLAEQFLKDEHDVVVVDPDADALAAIDSSLDVLTIHGNGADPATLEEAGVGKTDLLVAVAEQDDTNLLACIFARARGVPKTVARVATHAYERAKGIDFPALGVDLLVNQYDEYAEDLYNVLRLPGAIEVADLLDEHVMVVGMSVHMDSPIVGATLRGFPKPEWLRKIRFIALCRGDEITAPRGDTSFLVGDEVYFAGLPDDIAAFMQWAWPEHRRFQRIVVAGGGELGLRLARRLEKSRMQVFLVEKDAARADYCAERLARARVVKGDALDRSTLEGLGPDGDMAYVATTGSDEHNIIGCLVAERSGAHFTAARIASAEYIGIVDQHRLLDRVVDPRLAMTNAILHFVRGRNVSAAAILARLPGELLEVTLASAHPWASRAIRELDLPDGATIVAVRRGTRILTAVGELRLAPGDRIAIYAFPRAIDALEAALGDPSA